ncbi:MAG: acyltransferase family protein [Salinivirgaceae bacterium]|nr:acyltransferase family protein [Salinivirgaceae bacterium]
MRLVFNKTGYDTFIDFLKAYAIICVVIAHCFPSSLWNYCLFQVWADMQVPMFILIQVFHAYKRGTKPTIKWTPLLKRIVVPFVIIQIIILLYRLWFSGQSAYDVLISSVVYGGYGPGSYYFWIYIQVAIILVLMYPLVQKLTRRQLTWLFLFFSVGCECCFSLINLPDVLYRLLAIRYLFLIPLALIWVNEGVILNVRNVLLSILSIIAVVFFSFWKVDLEPLFYNSGWATHRWICYFYLPTLLTYALWYVYRSINKSKLSFFIEKIAKSSYEIYLIQMMVFVMLPIYRLSFIHSGVFRLISWMMLMFVLSIIGGIVMHNVLQKLLGEKQK